jgi:hypothetical protein
MNFHQPSFTLGLLAGGTLVNVIYWILLFS